MNDETRLAFAHPLERAKASSISTQYDRISLRDHIVEVEIGAFQLERGVTQRVSFNIVVEVQPIEQPILDDVDRILSYDRLTEAIAIELGAERLNYWKLWRNALPIAFCWNLRPFVSSSVLKNWIAAQVPWVLKLCVAGVDMPPFPNQKQRIQTLCSFQILR